MNQLSIIERAKLQEIDSFFRMKLHAIRIGHIAIVTNPFELYVEYGLQVKARSRARQTFIAELADDRGGYLPTAGAIASGGYSTDIFSVQVGDDGGQLLVEHTLQTIQSLWADE